MSSHRFLRAFVPIAVLAATASFRLAAQEWSAAQREVWEAIEECNRRYVEEDSTGILACYHDDFVGWRYGDPVPRTKDSIRTLLPAELEAAETIASDLRPIAIRVRGDVAVAHYAIRWVEKDAKGEMATLRMIWTDTLLRENGRWRWLADHGGTVETD
jgi:ketosteroid isomerase-like protein